MVFHFDEVDRIQNNRSDDHNSLRIDRPDQPSRPTSLGSTGNREIVASGSSLGQSGANELLNGVHRSDGGLDHGEADQPLGLRRIVEEMIPSEGDDRILCSTLLNRIGGESDVFVGDIEENSGDRSGGHGQGSGEGDVLGMRIGHGLTHSHSGDPQRGILFEFDFIGNDDDEPVPPDTFSIGGRSEVSIGEPSLGSHVQGIG
jgi:hypothetical protein